MISAVRGESVTPMFVRSVGEVSEKEFDENYSEQGVSGFRWIDEQTHLPVRGDPGAQRIRCTT